MSGQSLERGGVRAIPVPVVDRIARRIMLAAAHRIRVGLLTIVLPDGSREVVGQPGGPEAEIRIHDERGVLRMLLGGETGAGEAYMDGLWSSPDLAALLKLASRNRDALALTSGWWRRPLQVPRILAHRARRNTVRQASRNIQRHYDLGNDFYRLFLDETMTYSSAVFDVGRSDARRRPADEVPGHGRARRAPSRNARPRDRVGLGRVRPPRRRRARLPT